MSPITARQANTNTPKLYEASPNSAAETVIDIEVTDGKNPEILTPSDELETVSALSHSIHMQKK